MDTIANRRADLLQRIVDEPLDQRCTLHPSRVGEYGRGWFCRCKVRVLIHDEAFRLRAQEGESLAGAREWITHQASGRQRCGLYIQLFVVLPAELSHHPFRAGVAGSAGHPPAGGMAMAIDALLRVTQQLFGDAFHHERRAQR